MLFLLILLFLSFIITVDKRQDWWSLATRLIADELLAAAPSAIRFDKLLTLFHSVKISQKIQTNTDINTNAAINFALVSLGQNSRHIKYLNNWPGYVNA